ncbi:MAG: tetratricopeptide repeat protein [Raineya sp.]|nr:tetratricopeptide repeat protein [Raineya sp.]
MRHKIKDIRHKTQDARRRMQGINVLACLVSKQACFCFLLFAFLTNFPLSAQTNKQELYEKAIEKFEKGNFAEGYKLLDECLKKDSLWREALYAKGYFEMEEEEFQKAEQSFSQVIRYYPNDTASYLGRARAKMYLQKYRQAFSDLNKILQMDSTHRETLIEMGLAHCSAGYPKAAQNYFDKLLARSPNDNQILYFKAFAYWLDKDFTKAENLIQKVLKQEPEHIEAQRLKAYLMHEKGSYKETIRIFEQLLKKNSNIFKELDFYYWAKSLYKTRNYKQAISIAQSPKKISSWELYYVQALCYFQQKKYAEAWKNLQEAEKLNPNLPAEFFYDKAIVAYYVKLQAEAKENYLKALSIMPELYLLRNEEDEKADVLLDANRLFQKDFTKNFLDSILVTAYQERCLNILEDDETDQALKDIQKALALDSLNSKSYTIRGIIYTMQGKFEEAHRNFEKAEKLPKQRDLGYLYLMRGLSAAAAQNMGQAIFYLDKAISHNPKQANYYAEKANLLFEIGDTEGAFANIDKAIFLAPQEVDYRLDKINFLHEVERYDDVLKECEKVLKINPDAVEVYYFRGMAHWSLKNKLQARKDLTFFLQYYPDDKEAQKALKLMD